MKRALAMGRARMAKSARSAAPDGAPARAFVSMLGGLLVMPTNSHFGFRSLFCLGVSACGWGDGGLFDACWGWGAFAKLTRLPANLLAA